MRARRTNGTPSRISSPDRAQKETPPNRRRCFWSLSLLSGSCSPAKKSERADEAYDAERSRLGDGGIDKKCSIDGLHIDDGRVVGGRTCAGAVLKGGAARVDVAAGLGETEVSVAGKDIESVLLPA